MEKKKGSLGRPKEHVHKEEDTLVRGHNFEVVTFLEPVNCKVCGKFIWGLLRQGCNCVLCKSAPVHKDCVQNVAFRCAVEVSRANAPLSINTKSFRRALERSTTLMRVKGLSLRKEGDNEAIVPNNDEIDIFGAKIDTSTFAERRRKVLTADLAPYVQAWERINKGSPFAPLQADSNINHSMEADPTPPTFGEFARNSSLWTSSSGLYLSGALRSSGLQRSTISSDKLAYKLHSWEERDQEESDLDPRAKFLETHFVSVEYNSPQSIEQIQTPSQHGDSSSESQGYGYTYNKDSPVEPDQFSLLHESRYPMFFGFHNHVISPYLEVIQTGDWNAQFQNSVEALRRTNLNLNAPKIEKVASCLSLINLARDFVFTANQVGRFIISEYELPYATKTIKPSNKFGGFAGGQKYFHHNILFKFALDTNGIYGSDYAASKVADHELKGASYAFNLVTSDPEILVNFPLICTIEYMGFKLIATSVVPIANLVYGTADAGRTVHKGDKGLARTMGKMSRALGLCKHLVGTNRENTQNLWCVSDLEGHQGNDDRFYLLDFSRLFPPLEPQSTAVPTHLFQLFRPEFVEKYAREFKPLCSDAFSGFIRFDSKKTEYNQDIKDATNHLLTVVVPEASRDLEVLLAQSIEDGIVHEINIKKFLHSRGINLRWIGAVRSHMKNPGISVLLLNEIFARVIKNEVNAQLRKRAHLLKNFTQEPYRRLIANILNQVFGKENLNFWNYLAEIVPTQFPNSLSAAEQKMTGEQLSNMLFLSTMHGPSPFEAVEVQYPPSLGLVVFALGHTILVQSVLARQIGQVIALKVSLPNKNRPENFTIDLSNLKVFMGSSRGATPAAQIHLSFECFMYLLTRSRWPSELTTLEMLEAEHTVGVVGDRSLATKFLFDLLPHTIRPWHMFCKNDKK